MGDSKHQESYTNNNNEATVRLQRYGRKRGKRADYKTRLQLYLDVNMSHIAPRLTVHPACLAMEPAMY